MVVITGQVPTHAIGVDAFQECDTVGITRPSVKHNFLVKDVKRSRVDDEEGVPHRHHRPPGPGAWSTSPRTSPAQTASSTTRRRSTCAPTTRSQGARRADQEGDAAPARGQAADGVHRRRRHPRRCLRASSTELVRMLGFPCTNTLMGLGGYPATDKQFLGMLGMHGTYEANMAMQHCDVLLAVGARFDDRVIGNPKHFAPGAARKIIHIDIDPSSISKRVKVDVPIVGNVQEVLDEMLRGSSRPAREARRGGARRLVEADRRMARQGLPALRPQVDDHQAAVRDREALRSHQGRGVRHLRRRPAPDVGGAVLQVRPAAALDQLRRPRDDGLRPAGAMGVQFANPEARRWRALPAKSSIQMCIQELSTCKQYRLPIKIVNLNNRYMGMVRQWQEFFHGNRYSESYMDALPDFVKLAEGYGHRRHAGREARRRRAGAARGVRAARTTWSSSTSSPTRPRTYSRWSPAARGSPR